MQKLSQHLLEGLGLTEAQGAVYLAALELGEASMQELARKSRVKRTSIYAFIDDLNARGFLTEVMRRKRRAYQAVDPRQLLEVERSRVVEFERALPELLAVHNRAAGKPRVTFYEGLDGIKSVYADMLRVGKEILAYEDAEQRLDALGEEYVTRYPAERARRKILFRSILRDSPAAHALAQQNRELLRQSKFLSASDAEIHGRENGRLTAGGAWRTEINIYGDKVALFNFRAATPFCVRIEDADLAETLRVSWHALWDRLEGPAVG